MPTKVRARSAAAAVAGKNGHSLISDAKFRQLYATLLKYRLIEERLSSGLGSGGNHAAGAQNQIAGAVGVTLNLEREDTVVLTPSGFLTKFVKGSPLPGMLNHEHANGNGCGATFSGSAVSVLTPASPALSAQLGFATGAALANKLAKNHTVTVAFIEDGAALEGCTEALEVASAQKLPIVYVIEKKPGNASGEFLNQMNELFPVITVDAHDVVAVYRVAHESITRVREGGGPALIACMTYPLNGAAVNAVENMERYLTGKKLFRERWKDEVISEFERETKAALPSQR